VRQIRSAATPSRLLRGFIFIGVALSGAAYASGAISADICHAYRSGAIAGPDEGACRLALQPPVDRAQ
jgi:hypothetical protein